MQELIRLELNAGVATIRLDRPPANALDRRLAAQLSDAARRVSEDDAVRAVVLWGGPQILSAGADIKEMAGFGPREVAPVVGALGESLSRIEAIPKVVIAAVNGFALGGGCELALCADFRFAARDATLGQPEIRLGIIPGAGGTQRLPRLVGLQRARDMIYTGRRVTAREALAMGLVDRVLPPTDVYPEAVSEARRYATGPTLAYRAAKLAVSAAAQVSQSGGLETERELFRDLFATRDQREGLRAFLDKSEPNFEGR